MTTRVDLPNGQWAEVKDPDDLTGADIDTYEDWLDAYREEVLGPPPAPEPDPENPAVMRTPPRRGNFTAAETHRIRDKILEVTVTAWSYGLPLPYTTEARASLPGRACRKLDEAAGPAGAVLNNAEEEIEPDPKPGSGSAGTGGSTGTSPENTESPLPG